jgi:N2227-like protein
MSRFNAQPQHHQQHHQQHQQQHQRDNGPNDQDHNEQEQDHEPPNRDVHSLSLAYQTYLRHDDEEKNHFDDVCQSFRQYATFAMAQWANQQYRVHSLSESQRRVLPNALKRDTAEFNQRATSWKEATIRNQFCLDCILRHAGMAHSQQVTTTVTQVVSDGQISKVSSVLKSLARDWSTDGKAERDMAYGPILKQIKKFLPLTDTSRPKICVPGAGVLCIMCLGMRRRQRLPFQNNSPGI